MKIVAIISGGMDSVTMLHRLKKDGHRVIALSFDYGQRHIRELEMATINCQALGIPHRVINMRFMRDMLSNSALTSREIEVPEGHYEDESMKLTVVPNRNMIMASIAIGVAVNEDGDAIAMGVHAGDHAIYPDCRPEFIEALSKVAEIANYKSIAVLTPYLNTDKAGIVKDGLELNVDYSRTHTCYKGGNKACGKCGSCQERLEAFAKNGVVDPIEYEGL